LSRFAYIGAHARSYISEAKGLTIYCWPQPGGTNPHAIEELQRDGANVHFVDRLHAKVYWSRARGVILGSPNLSSNALGEGGLIETAIHLSPGTIEVESFFGSLRPIQSFSEKLRWLHAAHARFVQRNPQQGRSAATKSPLPTFAEWATGNRIQEWRLGWANTVGDPPKDAVAALAEFRGSPKFAVFSETESVSDYKKGVFVLEFYIIARKDGRVRVSHVNWWLPEFVTPTTVRSWQDYPYIWFAHRRVPAGARPPFQSQDPRFRRALERAINSLGRMEWLLNASTRPSSAFIRRLLNYYDG
jgi:hypothetical protein